MNKYYLKGHQEEISYEEYVILSADAKYRELVEEPMYDLIAMSVHKDVICQDENYLNFCLNNLLKMHHESSASVLLEDIKNKISAFKTVGFTYFDLLVEIFFLKGPRNPTVSQINVFSTIQRIIFIELCDDLIEQLFLDDDCEYCIFTIIKESNDPKVKKVFLIFFSALEFEMNSNHNYEFAEKLCQRNVVQRIICFLIDEVMADKSTFDIPQLSNPKDILKGYFKVVDLNDIVNIPNVPIFFDFLISKINFAEPKLNQRDLLFAFDYFEKFLSFHSNFDHELDQMEKLNGIETAQHMFCKALSKKVVLFEKFNIFNILSNYLLKRTDQTENIDLDFSFAALIRSIFAPFIPKCSPTFSKYVSDESKMIAKSLTDNFIPILTQTYNLLNKIDSSYQIFINNLISTYDNSPELIRIFIGITANKISHYIDASAMQNDYNSIPIMGTYLLFFMNLSLTNENESVFPLIIQNDERNVKEKRIDIFFSVISFLFDQKSNSGTNGALFWRDLMIYFNYILSDQFIIMFSEDQDRYDKILSSYSLIVSFVTKYFQMKPIELYQPIVLMILDYINKYQKEDKFISFISMLINSRKRNSNSTAENIFYAMQPEKMYNLIFKLLISFNSDLIKSGIDLLKEFNFDGKQNLLKDAILQVANAIQQSPERTIRNLLFLIESIPDSKAFIHSLNDPQNNMTDFLYNFMINYYHNRVYRPDLPKDSEELLEWIEAYFRIVGFDGLKRENNIIDFLGTLYNNLDPTNVPFATTTAIARELTEFVGNWPSEELKFFMEKFVTIGQICQEIIPTIFLSENSFRNMMKNKNRNSIKRKNMIEESNYSENNDKALTNKSHPKENKMKSFVRDMGLISEEAREISEFGNAFTSFFLRLFQNQLHQNGLEEIKAAAFPIFELLLRFFVIDPSNMRHFFKYILEGESALINHYLELTFSLLQDNTLYNIRGHFFQYFAEIIVDFHQKTMDKNKEQFLEVSSTIITDEYKLNEYVAALQDASYKDFKNRNRIYCMFLIKPPSD